MNINLAKSEIIHFVGIGGIGMSGLALVMKGLGFKIQGSDKVYNKNIERLKKNHVKFFLGHTKSNIKRVYLVNVIGTFNNLKLKSLNQKIYAAKIYKNPHVSLTHTNKNKHILRFELTEGKNREIRNICEIFNLKVERLKRISFGQYKVKSIPLSKYKEIIIHESN